MIPSHYLIVGAVGLACVAGGVGYIKGRESGLEKFYEYRTAVESQMEAVRVENAERLAAMAETARQDAEGWAAARRDLAARPVRVRVQYNNCSTGGLSPTPVTPGKPDAETPQLRPDTEISLTVSECEDKVANAVVDAAQLVHLQHFLINQHEAGK